MYTDEQRQKIAEREYETYTIGEPVIIKDKGKDITIGYVAEIEKTGSGFKAYVITDIKLPKNPTKQDFDKVNQVTMLYEGSTASFESVEKGWDTFLDWVINDLPMAARVTVPDWVPTRGTVQLRKAAEFTNDSMEKYRHAYFDFYGHSLGSMNTQYGVTSVNNEHLDRISGVYLYNGLNTYRVFSSEQRLKEKILHSRIYNYIDPLDIVGIGYDQKEGAVGQVFKVMTTKNPEGLIKQHMWGGYTYDDYGNMVDKYGLIVNQKNYIGQVDIDGDGTEDIRISSANTEPRNLFLSGGSLSVFGSETITINPDSLRMLSSNLNMLCLTEIPMLINLCRLCQEKNTKIQGDFETRKQKVEESIVQRFKETRLTDVFYQLHDSVGQAIAQKHIFDNLASVRSISYGALPASACHQSGAYFDISPYNSLISNLKTQSGSLYQHSQAEQIGTSSSGFSINPTPSALKCSEILEQTAKHLKEQAEKIFEGRGLREGKKDGISEALTEVLAVEERNLSQLNASISNAAQLTLTLANHFQQMDEWLSGQISSGGNIDYLAPTAVPSSYQAYLEESNIFDDVKDVLQAFDSQVEQNSDSYARIVGTSFSEAFRSVQSSLDDWLSSIGVFNSTVELIKESFTTTIYVESSEKVKDKIVTKQIYWGTLSEVYGSHITTNINEARRVFKSLPAKLEIALEISRTASADMQHLHPALKAIIEEGVYTAFDLDDIVASQKAVQSITDRIIKELSFAVSTISSQMTGQAATTLVRHLGAIQQLMAYFNRLVSDCFGNQSQAGASLPVETISPVAKNFSLN